MKRLFWPPKYWCTSISYSDRQWPLMWQGADYYPASRDWSDTFLSKAAMSFPGKMKRVMKEIFCCTVFPFAVKLWG